jgi:hypothetical protein
MIKVQDFRTASDLIEMYRKELEAEKTARRAAEDRIEELRAKLYRLWAEAADEGAAYDA